MNVRLKPIMFVGTCSDAGKSVINAAFAVYSSKTDIIRHHSRRKICHSTPTPLPKEEKWDVHRWYRPKPAGSPAYGYEPGVAETDE